MIKKTKDFYDNDVYQISDEDDEFIQFDEDEIKEIYDIGAKVLFSMESVNGWFGKVICETNEQAEKIAEEKINPKLVLLKLRGKQE